MKEEWEDERERKRISALRLGSVYFRYISIIILFTTAIHYLNELFHKKYRGLENDSF